MEPRYHQIFWKIPVSDFNSIHGDPSSRYAHVTPYDSETTRNTHPRSFYKHIGLPRTTLLGLLLFSGPACADDFQTALKAFNAGQYQRAEEHWKRCAQAGQANCQYGLGVLYDEGHERPQNPSQALHWFLRAAMNGSRDAQVQLGFIYATGRQGIDQAPVQAFVWFSMAANNGAKKAALYRDKVGQLLSTEEVDAAHRQLDELGIQYHLQE